MIEIPLENYSTILRTLGQLDEIVGQGLWTGGGVDVTDMLDALLDQIDIAMQGAKC